MTPNRPYLIRALHQWILDNGMTPHLLVDVNIEGVSVPQQYVDDGKIILNSSLNAVEDLELGNDWILFNARFSGVRFQIELPVKSVMAIYAKENGRGMVFPDEPEEEAVGEAETAAEENKSTEQTDNKPADDKKEKGKPHLTVIK